MHVSNRHTHDRHTSDRPTKDGWPCGRLVLSLVLFMAWALVSTTAMAQIRFERPGPSTNLRFTAAPPAPTLLSPANGHVVQQRGTTSYTQRLEWSAPSGNPQPDSYKIVLEEDGNPNGFVATQSGIAVGNGSGPLRHDMLLSPRFSGRVISWRVEACLGNRCTASARRMIRWTTRPSVPRLTQPAAGATAATRTPRLEWRDVRGASSYRLCVSDGGTCTLAPTSNANLFVESRNAAFAAPDLQAFQGRTVLWSAAACNSAGECSNFSSPRQLTIPQLQPPQLVAPGVPFIADFPSLRFEWRAPGLRPDSYTLCVAAPNEHCDTGAPFKRARIRNATRNTVSMSDLARYAGTTPNWTVGSCDASGCVWAAPRPIQIMAVPTVPALSAPMDGYAHANRSAALPAMAWGAVSGTTRYEFCTFPNGQACNGSRITVDANRTSCSFSGRFLPEGHHFWTVRACNGAWGCSNFAAPFSFHMPSAPHAGSHSVGASSSSSSGSGRSGGSVRMVSTGGGYGVCR